MKRSAAKLFVLLWLGWYLSGPVAETIDFWDTPQGRDAWCPAKCRRHGRSRCGRSMQRNRSASKIVRALQRPCWSAQWYSLACRPIWVSLPLFTFSPPYPLPSSSVSDLAISYDVFPLRRKFFSRYRFLQNEIGKALTESRRRWVVCSQPRPHRYIFLRAQGL